MKLFKRKQQKNKSLPYRDLKAEKEQWARFNGKLTAKEKWQGALWFIGILVVIGLLEWLLPDKTDTIVIVVWVAINAFVLGSAMGGKEL